MPEPAATNAADMPVPPGQAASVPTWRAGVLWLGVLAAVLIAFHVTDLDRAVVDGFYNRATGRWLTEDESGAMWWVCYAGAKALAIAVGVVCGVGVLLSKQLGGLAPARRGMLRVAVALIVIPLAVSAAKTATNMHTPRKLDCYGGTRPHRKLLEARPWFWRDAHAGRGFPAGHASGGFALMMLYFALPHPAGRRWGLAAGLALGWAMGLYQMLRGEHFLSHTVTTMILAWLLILAIVAVEEWLYVRWQDRRTGRRRDNHEDREGDTTCHGVAEGEAGRARKETEAAGRDEGDARDRRSRE